MSKRVKVGGNELCSSKELMTAEIRVLMAQHPRGLVEKFRPDPDPDPKVFWNEPEHAEHGLARRCAGPICHLVQLPVSSFLPRMA